METTNYVNITATGVVGISSSGEIKSKYLPGDIVILIRPNRPWYGFLWHLIKEMFTFFILRKGLIEAIDKYYHIKMASNNYISVTMEPPRCSIGIMESNIRVFRLKNKPKDFDEKFFAYVNKTLGRPFDYRKLFALILDAIFGTHKFGMWAQNLDKDVCNEWVSRFYRDEVGTVCCLEDPESSIPGNTKDYCTRHPEIFEEVI